MEKIVCSIEELCQVENMKIICFGAGEYLFHMLFDRLKKYQFEEKISFIIDNDIKKRNTEIMIRGMKIKILSFNDALKFLNDDTLIIISSDNYAEQIENQLKDAIGDINFKYCILKRIINYYRENVELKRIIHENLNKSARIPQIIHWCWFGKNALPELQKKCLASWKEKCPEYKIMEWNEETFDLNISQFAKEAYKCKKYAFVADYVRLWSIYKFGGIYLDSDVELIKNLDPFLCHSAFSGFEDRFYIPTGLMGGEPQSEWYRKLLSYYDNRHFITPQGLDLTTNCKIITDMTFDNDTNQLQNGFYELKDVTMYPQEVFCPLDWETKELNITNNTYSIHWFSGSWINI